MKKITGYQTSPSYHGGGEHRKDKQKKAVS
jgi:hypothetical protein